MPTIMTLSHDLHVAVILANRAVHITRTRFGYELDYSVESLNEIDLLLRLLPNLLPSSWLPPLAHRSQVNRELHQFSILWGCYLGEVLRRQLGASWLPVVQSDLWIHSFVVVLRPLQGRTIRLIPAQEVYSRMMDTSRTSLSLFYCFLSAQLSQRR